MAEKYLFISMGPGEASQAHSLAEYCWNQGKDIIFAVGQEINLEFLRDDKDRFNLQVTPTPDKFLALLKKTQPDVVICGNSKIWRKDKDFLDAFSSIKPLTVCLDSNWLFNINKYPYFSFLKDADLYLITMPSSIFKCGLREYGGGFYIEEDMLSKCKPVGFIPSADPLPIDKREQIRKQYSIHPSEKLIFLYGSGWGADYRGWMITSLLQAVRSLVQERNVKVLYIGPPIKEDIAGLDDWLLQKGKVGADEFYSLLASSDLVFQHQGLGTLTQAISAQVPTIVNIAIPGHPQLPEIHYWELEPFARNNLCHLLKRGTSQEIINKHVEMLLFNEEARNNMISAQKKQYVSGEENAFNFIKSLL